MLPPPLAPLRALLPFLILLASLTSPTTAQFTLRNPSNSTAGPIFANSHDFTSAKTFTYNASTDQTQPEQLTWDCLGHCTPPFQLNLMASLDDRAVLASNMLDNSTSYLYTWTPQGYDNITEGAPFYFLIADAGGYFNYTPAFYLEPERSANVSAGSSGSFGASHNGQTGASGGGSSNGLGAGAIAGIVAGICAALGILVYVGNLLWRRRRRRNEERKQVPDGLMPRSPQPPPVPELESWERVELEGGNVQRRAELAVRGERSKAAPDQRGVVEEKIYVPVEYYGSFTGKR
ncbi:MAG: hypothetical protein Q9159_004799 [Coniocarpon cinnabarinum]